MSATIPAGSLLRAKVLSSFPFSRSNHSGSNPSQPCAIIASAAQNDVAYVLVQAAIVELLADLRRDMGLAMLFVTHNLPLVRSLAQRVVVLAEGRVVEQGPTAEVLTEPDDD